MGEGFRVAYHGGCVMGFCLVSISILTLMGLILIYKSYLITPFSKTDDYRILFEAIAGFGLGGSAVALFCRVGGGIFTKAADVGADLVSKLENGWDEDDPNNPACIADNVGDNVGDIAGMGSDLFGSLAESTCAALLVSSTSEELINTGGYYYPILISSAGILVCIFTTIIAFISAGNILKYNQLEWAIKLQMIISTALMLPCVYIISKNFLPLSYSIGEVGTVTYKEGVTQYETMICPMAGLISGMLIGIITEYYTSMAYRPVLDLVNGCKKGAAINVILGLALGYLSNVIPTFLIAGTIYASYRFAGMFGIALAAIGMLGNLGVCLAIDGYGPISDNAGGIVVMALTLAQKSRAEKGLDQDPISKAKAEIDMNEIRKRTDDLDAAGNTTAAIGKGFAIGSACLVAFALYGAFVTRTNLDKVNLNTPIVFSGLLFGSMIPYLFSALTMKAVGKAASAMVIICRDGIKKGKEFLKDENRYHKCIQVSTEYSLEEMILPGLLVTCIPITLGVLFGPKAVAGFLIGVIISGIQMATSSANTGGAWDNCKKSIKRNLIYNFRVWS
jgi:Na+/H+-translocating membrane pyrophosphatase